MVSTPSAGEPSPESPATIVAITKALIVRTVNGAVVTIIEGASAMRCVFIANNATLAGFTLRTGATPSGGQGGGVRGTDAFSCIVTTCILSGNAAGDGGGASECTFDTCELTGNSTFGTGFNYPTAIAIQALIVAAGCGLAVILLKRRAGQKRVD